MEQEKKISLHAAHAASSRAPQGFPAAAAGAHEDRPHVTWDEETIAEHDLLRGTRQKIDEPNTPYHYYGSDHEDDAEAGSHHDGEHGAVSPTRSLSGREHAPTLEWGELHTKLQHVQDTKKASEWDSSDDESSGAGSTFAERDEEGKKIHKDPKFAEKRKSHYKEFERVKAWRQMHAKDDDDDEEEEEEEEEVEAAALGS